MTSPNTDSGEALNFWMAGARQEQVIDALSVKANELNTHPNTEIHILAKYNPDTILVRADRDNGRGSTPRIESACVLIRRSAFGQPDETEAKVVQAMQIINAATLQPIREGLDPAPVIGEVNE